MKNLTKLALVLTMAFAFGSCASNDKHLTVSGKPEASNGKSQSSKEESKSLSLMEQQQQYRKNLIGNRR